MTPLLPSIETTTGNNPDAAVIWLHGLGADGGDFAAIVPELDLTGCPPIRFVFPHAPTMPVTVNGGYAMPAWYDIFGSDLQKREDEVGIRLSALALEALIAREVGRGIATDRIVLAGFSQGCAMVLHTGLRHPARLAGIVALSGYLPLSSQLGAQVDAANRDVPIFMAHGNADPMVVLPRAQASRDALLALGYRVQWHSYPMGHSVHPSELHDIALFLQSVLVPRRDQLS